MIDRFERFSCAIFDIYKYWHKLAAEEMEKYGLRGPHSVYLTALMRSERGLTASQMCEVCSKDKADVSRMMNIMEGKGLVEKAGGFQNRYGGYYLLTEKGKEAAEHVRGRVNIAVELAGRDLTEEQRAVFYQALESITANLRRLSEQGLPEA